MTTKKKYTAVKPASKTRTKQYTAASPKLTRGTGLTTEFSRRDALISIIQELQQIDIRDPPPNVDQYIAKIIDRFRFDIRDLNGLGGCRMDFLGYGGVNCPGVNPTCNDGYFCEPGSFGCPPSFTCQSDYKCGDGNTCPSNFHCPSAYQNYKGRDWFLGGLDSNVRSWVNFLSFLERLGILTDFS